MPQTTATLYRSGNSTSARMDNVRVPKDITVHMVEGEQWVTANSGGVSTSSNQLSGKNVWRLNQGYNYSNDLNVVNDHGTHYNWQPNKDMPLSVFEGLLTEVNNYFVKIS